MKERNIVDEESQSGEDKAALQHRIRSMCDEIQEMLPGPGYLTHAVLKYQAAMQGSGQEIVPAEESGAQGARQDLGLDSAQGLPSHHAEEIQINTPRREGGNTSSLDKPHQLDKPYHLDLPLFRCFFKQSGRRPRLLAKPGN